MQWSFHLQTLTVSTNGVICFETCKTASAATGRLLAICLNQLKAVWKSETNLSNGKVNKDEKIWAPIGESEFDRLELISKVLEPSEYIQDWVTTIKLN